MTNQCRQLCRRSVIIRNARVNRPRIIMILKLLKLHQLLTRVTLVTNKTNRRHSLQTHRRLLNLCIKVLDLNIQIESTLKTKLLLSLLIQRIQNFLLKRLMLLRALEITLTKTNLKAIDQRKLSTLLMTMKKMLMMYSILK